jgi:homoserine dehydrogenase
MRQYGHDAATAPVLIVTHDTLRATLDKALKNLPHTGVLEGTPIAIRIESV